MVEKWPPSGIIFSLERELVWASWQGVGPRICLGRMAEVSGMMRDFLDQMDVADRLMRGE